MSSSKILWIYIISEILALACCSAEVGYRNLKIEQCVGGKNFVTVKKSYSPDGFNFNANVLFIKALDSMLVNHYQYWFAKAFPNWAFSSWSFTFTYINKDGKLRVIFKSKNCIADNIFKSFVADLERPSTSFFCCFWLNSSKKCFFCTLLIFWDFKFSKNFITKKKSIKMFFLTSTNVPPCRKFHVPEFILIFYTKKFTSV